MGVLRHELPDQQVLNFPIIANGQIAPLVTMSCRILLRRVASRGFLPRERFSPLGQKATLDELIRSRRRLELSPLELWPNAQR